MQLVVIVKIEPADSTDIDETQSVFRPDGYIPGQGASDGPWQAEQLAAVQAAVESWLHSPTIKVHPEYAAQRRQAYEHARQGRFYFDFITFRNDAGSPDALLEDCEHLTQALKDACEGLSMHVSMVSSI